MSSGGVLNFHEFLRRVRRLCDGNFSYRKIVLLILIVGAFFLYLGPSIAQKFFFKQRHIIEAYEEHCMDERLAGFYFDTLEYNANTLHKPKLQDEYPYLPYVGNGIFGVPIEPGSLMYIKYGKTLSLAIPWQPLIYYEPAKNSIYKEATITHFTMGMVYNYQCFREGYHVGFQYYAHRDLDGIFVQEVKISNPTTSTQMEIKLNPPKKKNWINADDETDYRVTIDQVKHDLKVITGSVSYPNSNKIVAIAIAYQAPPSSLQLKVRKPTRLEYLMSIKYSDPISHDIYEEEKRKLIQVAQNNLHHALAQQQRGLKESHITIWQRYWRSGFGISDSKAQNSINGHQINATIYYILSQIPKAIPGVEKTVSNNEGCYQGHHTLDAVRLWKTPYSIDVVNELAKAWLITLDKQGCHRLITGNPSAVLQAIVLSLGGLRFSNHDLEFNIDPQYLHREFLFRRISYGNVTHLNISVNVNEDNRAVLGVAVDQSDSVYFGCDAGCLDPPVPLKQTYTNFPVKITKPLTAILYITSDYQHMQDLQNALHVHAVGEAPAHDHQVIALHKHGHELGGLPTFFWVTIFFLIVVFHLFLIKLIYNEYWDQKDSRRKVRYNKL